MVNALRQAGEFRGLSACFYASLNPSPQNNLDSLRCFTSRKRHVAQGSDVECNAHSPKQPARTKTRAKLNRNWQYKKQKTPVKPSAPHLAQRRGVSRALADLTATQISVPCPVGVVTCHTGGIYGWTGWTRKLYHLLTAPQKAVAKSQYHHEDNGEDALHYSKNACLLKLELQFISVIRNQYDSSFIIVM